MLTYENQSSGIVIEFSSTALDHFARNRQLDTSAPEAGGQLFATFASDVARIEIATGPRATDHRSRYGFRPDRHAEQTEIKKMFKRGLHFVGDWHSHPTQVPCPSPEDLRNIRAEVRQSIHQLKGFVLVVVGNAPFPAGLSVTLDTGKDALRLQVAATSTTSTL